MRLATGNFHGGIADGGRAGRLAGSRPVAAKGVTPIRGKPLPLLGAKRHFSTFLSACQTICFFVTSCSTFERGVNSPTDAAAGSPSIGRAGVKRPLQHQG
jgi:hypothetical protein